MAMHFEIGLVFGNDVERIICEGKEDTAREIRHLLFGGEPYTEEGGQLMIEIEDWLDNATPGDEYKKHGELMITAKSY